MIEKSYSFVLLYTSTLIQSKWSAVRPVWFVPEETAQGILLGEEPGGLELVGARQEKTNLCSEVFRDFPQL